MRLGQLTGLVEPGEGQAERPTRAEPARPPGPRPISIWEPRERAGDGASEPVWVRPPVGPLGDHYATTPELRPRCSDRGRPPIRICWFGESAAAGYLYAPHLTPARVLEAQLRTLTGGGAGGSMDSETYEVLDLARTNETLGSLVETVEASLQLEPDLLVVYTGNNWRLLETPEVSPHVPSVRSRQEIASALGVHHSAPAGPAGLARKRLATKARSALDQLAAIAAAAGVPLLLVLPEVNLADWESRQPPVWLPGDGTPRWYRLLTEGLRALDRRDWQDAERAAWAMNALDDSSCPTPFRLLARAWQGAGRLDEARDAALAEVDAVHYPLLAFLDAPRAGTDERTLLAEAALRHGLATVDLREVLAEAGGSPLPGRRFFLDYCHLTSEGMAALGAAVAEQVLRLCPLPRDGGERAAPEPRPWRELLDELPPPEVTPAAEATARFGAALHGAHRLLPLTSSREILEHWCGAALDADPGIARAMVDLAAARLALLDGVPAVLTEAYHRLQASPYRMTLQHGLRWGNLDGEVLRAIAVALERAGRLEARELEELLRRAGESAALSGSPLELAGDERFLAAPLERLLPEVMELPGLTGRATLRALRPVTAFELPTAATAPIDLELVARLPAIPGIDTPRAGRAEVTVNDRVIGHADLGEGWSRTRFTVPEEALPGGLGRLEIRWPELPPVGTEALDGARRRLEVGAEADLHPIFGEVASLALAPTGSTRSKS